MRNRIQSLIFVSVVLLSGCVKNTKIVYQDKNVTVVFKDSFFVLNVHGGVSHFDLTTCGKTYKDVRGYIPFHLEITNKESILFVTGRNEPAVIHIVNLKNQQEVHFSAHDSQIGYNIFPTNKPQNRFEEVETMDGGHLIISARHIGNNPSYRYYLDLDKKVFEKEEVTWIDTLMGKTNHYLHIGGKHTF